MAFLPPPVSPRAAWLDALGYIRQRRRHQLVFAALSLAAPVVLISAFMNEFNRTAEWQPPTVIYVKQWSAERTLAEVRAQQAKDLPAELAARKRIADEEAARHESLLKIKKQLSDIGIGK